MCPICWATALVSFGGILAISVLSVAGNDKMTLAFAAVLGVVFALDRFEIFTPAWYTILALILAIVGRVLYLVVFRWRELLISRAWLAALQIAARKCPKTRER